ncbi:MAG: cardiolipin synthase [Thermoanaerobaculia bacterium]
MAIALLLFHILGAISSVHAIMSTRTSQGAVAWVVSLNTFPYIAVPAYWVLGRNKFQGYVTARQLVDEELVQVAPATVAHVEEFMISREGLTPGLRMVDTLTDMPFTGGNDVKLLIDGDATFASILEGIGAARDYILFQFYIIKDDDIGGQIKELLIRKANEGVRIYFLYDEIGSSKLPRSYHEELQAAGVEVSAFNTTQGRRNRFQLNFRNHRKIVVTDGHSAWIGGHNVGDEYLGRDPKFGHWRDTHVRMEGPAVIGAQISFAEDWYWATGASLALDWQPDPSAKGDRKMLVIPTSPADARETASLMFIQAISAALDRVWIASPYFVPDEGVLKALELADLRGVDVRILIPDEPDHMLVYLAAFTFVDELANTNIGFYRYTGGFLHQKVVLIDDHIAVVGTANLDNRSLRLNFEVSALAVDLPFAREVAAMLEEDFSQSRKMQPGEFRERPFWFRFAARAARLTAPIL